MQKFISQPSDKLDGTYEIARWNERSKEYETLSTSFLCRQDAENAARQYNIEYEEELAKQYEYEHQNELIEKYHDYALSQDIQKQNSARDFFSRFPYQRDICKKILEDMSDK